MRRAFTLVEALVAMGLLTVVALLIMTLFPKTLAEQKQLSVRSLVVQKADHEMAQAVDHKPVLAVGDYPVEKMTLSDGTVISGNLKVSAGPLTSVREFELVLNWEERGIKLDFHQKRRVADVSE